tara:strand:- start:4042 stop:4365 length:324 start_codon:yes stop_codon:yes gene_type:complete
MLDLNSGSLVKINRKSISPDGLLMLGTDNNGKICIYESINLNSYPSSSDFFGNTIAVEDAEIGLVVRKVGRPCKIRQDTKFSCYDIYEIIIKNKIYHAFRYNLDIDY